MGVRVAEAPPFTDWAILFEGRVVAGNEGTLDLQTLPQFGVSWDCQRAKLHLEWLSSSSFSVDYFPLLQPVIDGDGDPSV